METFEYALPVGTVLDDKYQILEILGEGGFGITYKARDIKLDLLVAIKEYLPQEFAARATNTVTVQARSNRADDYQYGLERFLDEARNLAKFKHPNIVRVATFVECHGTAYFVMDYEEGQELGEWLKNQPGSLSEDTILKIITPILNGLAKVHELGLLHRDIKPANIFLRGDGGPVLIDFGAARQALGEHSKSISAIVSQGYAPPEQYTTRGKQGPYTDLYAIGATLYQLITGQHPVDASDRSHAIHEGDEDPLMPATVAGKGKVSDWLLQLTDQLLNIVSKNRPQSAQAVLDAIHNKTTATIDASGPTSTAENTNNKTRVIKEDERFAPAATGQSSSATKRKTGLYASIAAAVLLVIGAGIYLNQQPTDSVSENSKGVSVATQQPNKPLAQGKAILFVESEPSGAEVFLDDSFVGKTPYQADNLPAGQLTLLLKHDMSNDYSEQVMLADNLVVNKTYQLKPATGNYSVFSTPDGARISLDGKDTGKVTPNSLRDIKVGQHTLKLSKDAYYPKEQTIYVRKGETLKQEITLEGGNLVKYEGKWIEPVEKERLMAEADKLYLGKMIFIPSGSFQMGSNNGEKYERPVHRVDIKAFKLGETEVTQKQWQAVMGNNPSEFKNCDNCPVENVSWDDVQTFIKRLNNKTGQRFRLPSEAEWEYATRAGSSTKYSWGDSINCSQARYGYYKGDCGHERKTVSVKSFNANAFGLYDMHGNVWEWTQDCWNVNYNVAPTDGSATTSGDCGKRVLRGGSWDIGPGYLRSAFRFRLTVAYRGDNGGFRLAQDAP